jgi:acetyltransferase-like isoleucine patch superfamily enzyme
MSGRKLFEKLAPFLTVVVSVFKILPRPCRLFLWSCVHTLRGNIGIGLRYCLAKSLLKSCGNNVLIGTNVEVSGWDNLVLGNNVSIHKDCYLDASGGLTIGSNVSIAHQTSILTNDHGWDDESLPIKYNPLKPGAVRIADDVWIGCGVRIFSRVQIESRSIVAGGAIVTRSVAARTIVGGNPARLIKEI